MNAGALLHCEHLAVLCSTCTYVVLVHLAGETILTDIHSLKLSASQAAHISESTDLK